METLKNWEIGDEGKRVTVEVNPSIYPLEVIYSAAYMLIDRAYVIIDGDPEKEINVEFTEKEDCDLEKLAQEFNNELVNYAVYVTQAARNQSLREAIINRALQTNSQTFKEWKAEAGQGGRPQPRPDTEGKTSEPKIEEEDYVKDPKGIAETWKPEDAEGAEEESSEEEDLESEKEEISKDLEELGY